ncbi:zinc ribbon domain-containing protein [Peribacillus sp. TH14]|uniref:zinc ribbon domain-containing protein n=1 Tax=Peribacillus sp. TH14 TaxID=2798481 RepID=UPI001A90EA3A|nr:zinc ribbon domain-containing protein [Peribacillus sp. TH14]
MSEYLLNDEQSKDSINNIKYYEAVNEWVSTVEHFHSSLKSRMPRYQNFINAGIDLLNIILEEIKQLNKNKEPDRKFVYFALSAPMPTELEKVIQILEYAGLVTQDKDISKGTKGVFQRYMIHLGKIIQYNALAQGKVKTFEYISECLQKTKTRQFKRFVSKSLFTEEMVAKCKFELPPCSSCGNQRTFDEAKFCAYCGAKLESASLFLELIEQDISALPLTSKRVEMIKTGSNIVIIKDILMDDNGVELKKVKGIQGYWAQKIKDYAEEFIGG